MFDLKKQNWTAANLKPPDLKVKGLSHFLWSQAHSGIVAT